MIDIIIIFNKMLSLLEELIDVIMGYLKIKDKRSLLNSCKKYYPYHKKLNFKYMIYHVYSDYGYGRSNLLAVCDTLHWCRLMIQDHLLKNCIKTSFYKCMNEQNKFTVLGNRNDFGSANCYGDGGYIIEETELNKWI